MRPSPQAALERLRAAFKVDKENVPAVMRAIIDEAYEAGRRQGAAGEPLFVPPEDSLLEFPCIGKIKTWCLTSPQLEEWRILFPGVDVMMACRSALAWVKANRAKTARGMPRFLVAWITRMADSGKGQLPVNGTAQSQKQVRPFRPVPTYQPHEPWPEES